MIQPAEPLSRGHSRAALRAALLCACALIPLCQAHDDASRIDGSWASAQFENSHEEIRSYVNSLFPDASEFQLVIPELLESRSDTRRVSPRAKRFTREEPTPATLHYHLSAFGQHFELELAPVQALVAPGFSVYVLGEAGISRREVFTVGTPEEFCFYQGELPSHPGSSAAIALCHGLAGVIRTPSVEYFISPLPKNTTGHTAHVLYKRSPRSPVRTRREDGEADQRGTHMAGDVGGTEDEELHGSEDRVWSREEAYRRGTKQRQHYCGRRKKYMPKPPGKDLHIMEDEYSFLSRGKRSAIHRLARKGENTLETLVVVDKKMVERHGKENITNYVLTIFNIVSSLFKDGSIGNAVNIVLVGLIILEKDQPGLLISHHADHTLSSFCQWQSHVAGNDGIRHDHAILLTGLDICSWKNEPCDTLGYAPISGMCSRYRSCTVNEDSGLGLAFTIAHESGHNFGMVHDGDGNVCKKWEGHIMAPTLTGQDGVFSWSACSRQSLLDFLSSPQALCLADVPKRLGELSLPSRLPGEMYDADTQCRWQFGHKAMLCTFDIKKDICKALWCHKGGRRCETKFMPAAEGTVCGQDKWCRRGRCVKLGDKGPKPVNGRWSLWTAWSPCSYSCGGGVRRKERHCTNPRPQYGGRYCSGRGKVFRLCNTLACPANSTEFRALQCAEFNGKPFRGWYYKWKPYTRVEDKDICRLYCMAEDFNFFFAMSGKAKDGTRCYENRLDVCVEGVCQPVGCDHVLGSNATHDACGVCKGDNSTCQFFHGEYTAQHRANEYHRVATIPAGARSITVAEKNISGCYLATRSSDHHYHLTGAHRVSWPGHYQFAGTMFDYKRPYNNPESLTAVGPTKETLIIELLVFGANPGITWEYTMPKPNSDAKTMSKLKKDTYKWVVVRSACSKTCAKGWLSAKPICQLNGEVAAEASHCDQNSRPQSKRQPCNKQPCPPKWIAGAWGECSRTCGKGQQVRRVWCTRRTAKSKQQNLPMESCASKTKPANKRYCKKQKCPAAWVTGPWSECSKTCGRGIRKRDVFCHLLDSGKASRPVPHGRCRGLSKPPAKQKCTKDHQCKHVRQHLQWVLSAWSTCTASCGTGVQTRELKCSKKSSAGRLHALTDHRCHRVARPIVELERSCNAQYCTDKHDGSHKITASSNSLPPTPLAGWYAGPWNQCSKTCGAGEQTRTVKCLSQGRPAKTCAFLHRPASHRVCQPQACTTPNESAMCQDAFPWCSLVPQHGVCHHQYYGSQCCLSCSKSNL
uniref:A disintegrin and metalloproteinase with thrombospondin motifs 18-like n=1 Tax=Myxine glutinosa TaxID=7769 RepID=UPI0035901066